MQGGYRPVLIVQNDVGNKYSPTTTVVPMTSSQNKPKLPTHVPVDCLNRPSVILCEQIQTIDMRQLGDKVGRMPATIMNQVVKAMQVQFSGEYQIA